MEKSNKKPFIPRGKPKSWVVGVLSALIGLLIAGPIMLLGAYLNIGLIKGFGTIIFVACLTSFAVGWFIFAAGILSGKYRNIQDTEWRKQVW